MPALDKYLEHPILLALLFACSAFLYFAYPRTKKLPEKKQLLPEIQIKPEEKPAIRVSTNLFNMSGIGLLVPHPTNVLYWNQVGGHSNSNPELEGFFIPLNAQDFGKYHNFKNSPTELYDFFSGPKWKSWCFRGIDEETADFIDNFLSQTQITSHIKVDRTKFKESMEAWIHVTIDPSTLEKYSHKGITSCTAILTWPNSD